LIYAISSGEQSWNLVGFLYAATAGLSMELGMLAFYHALDAGPVSIVSPISSAYPLVTTLLVVWIFHGHLSTLDIFGIFTVVIGLVIASGIFTTKMKDRKLSKGMFYGLVTLVLWGIGYAVLGKAVTELGWQKATLLNMVTGLFILSALLLVTRGTRFLKDFDKTNLSDKYILVAAFLQLLAGVIFSIGLSRARSTATITTISSTYPALTVLLAIRHFGERIKIVAFLGAITTIIGVVMLSF
jgi:uncharacterized membrane protein